MCAYKRITESLAERGQPVDQIVVSGASAGGHLSLAVGLLNTTGKHTCRSQHPPRAVVNWFGITDIARVDAYLAETRPEQNYARTWAGSADGIARVSAANSPMALITPLAPPIITVHGTADTVVPYDQAAALHEALTTRNELVTLRDGKHGGFTDTQFQHAFDRIFTFLEGD